MRLEWFYQIEPATFGRALSVVLPEDCKGLFVHSSLGSCGYFAGGREAVVRALLERSTTLSMPTHTYCYPRGVSARPPLFDPRETRSLVGSLTDHFWRMDGVLRSLHPTHSIAALGPMAPNLTADHETCDTPCGKGTPYEKMITADFAVLMLGANLNSYTFFHTAEHAAGVPYLYFPEPYDLRVLDGSNREVAIKMLRQDMTVRRRFAAMDHELGSADLLRRARLGAGEILCIPNSLRTHEFLVETLRRDPYHLVNRA